jgi:hypothetical protein
MNRSMGDVNSGTGSATVPPPNQAGFWRSIVRSQYLLVLLLLGVSYTFCALQTTADPSLGALLVQLLTVAVTFWVAEVGQRLRRVGWIVLAAAGLAAVTVALAGAEGRLLDIALASMSMVAYGVAPMVIIASQARKREVDGQTLLAAIAAYVMVGMFFTFLFNLVAQVSAVPTFGDGHVDSLTTQLFFSFTTLTTTGYGNLVPVGPIVQSIAIAEAIAGQLFLVIAVSRVVAGWHPASLAASSPRD